MKKLRLPHNLPPRRLFLVAVVGLAAGFLSGLFGIGGGMIIVPALMIVLNMDQRRASATSLSAIIITAAVGAIVYASAGNISLPAMVLVAIGSLAGAQIGTWLLRILPNHWLPWIFVGFIAMIIVIGYFHQPSRDAVVEISLLSCLGMLGVGVVSGVFAGLVGVGGGGIIVPGLEIVVGASDVIARGTSLLTMIPTAISGTVSNWRHSLVDLPVGLAVGGTAALATPAGVWVAHSISPHTGSILFSLFLVAVAVSTVLKSRAQNRNEK